MAKIEIVQQGGLRRIVDVDLKATNGATIGVNVFNADGTLFVPVSGEGTGVPITAWSLILDIPPNVVALAQTSTTGLYTVTGDGTSETRAIQPVAGETTVINGSGVGGDPTVGLADVTPTAGGTIQRLAFDAKGRRSQQDTATTDNLAEGSTNLYFTMQRVRDTVLTGISFASSAVITAADTVLTALGKLQAQLNGKQNTLTNSTSNTISGTQVLRAALTGDVTAAANANATTIANNAVTNAKAADMATATIKGRIAAGTGDPEDLTPAQARTVIGAEPSIAAGTAAQFWRGDKTWGNTLAGPINLVNNANAPGMLAGLFGPYVASPNSSPAFGMMDAFGASTGMLFRRCNGSAASPTALATDDLIGQFQARGHDGSSYSSSESVAIWFEADGAWSNTSHAGRISFFTTPAGSTSPSRRLVIHGSGAVRPGADNTQILGNASFRWSEIFAANGTINTSDAREKTDVTPLSPAEILAASALAKLVGTYQWLEALKANGDGARHHVGMTVQSAIAVMKAEGLDPFRYGFICYDEWGAADEVRDEDGNVTQEARPAGTRYSFRMDQLCLFLAAGFEARLSALESSAPVT